MLYLDAHESEASVFIAGYEMVEAVDLKPMKIHIFISSYFSWALSRRAMLYPQISLLCPTNCSLSSSVYLFWDAKYLARSKNTLCVTRLSLGYAFRKEPGKELYRRTAHCSTLKKLSLHGRLTCCLD